MLSDYEKNAFVHVVARVKKTVPPHLKIVIRQKGIVTDVSQSTILQNLSLKDNSSFNYMIHKGKNCNFLQCTLFLNL